MPQQRDVDDPAGPLQLTEPVGTKVVGQDPSVTEWLRQYPLPSESSFASASHKAFLYRPPNTDLYGVLAAVTVIITWAMLFHHALFIVRLNPSSPGGMSSWVEIAATFVALEFMYTGLFITTHDSMHGTIAYRNRWLNDTLGHVAISCYAWFDYRRLRRKHWEHHNHCGIPRQDPDFHTGNPTMLIWYARFMYEYMTALQFVKLGVMANTLMFLGAPLSNILLYMTAAAVLSGFRLFYFGTYQPHRPLTGKADEIMDWTKSRTCPDPMWLSFFSCWCFGYHWSAPLVWEESLLPQPYLWEHHRWPYAPWWHLWHCRQLSER